MLLTVEEVRRVAMTILEAVGTVSVSYGNTIKYDKVFYYDEMKIWTECGFVRISWGPETILIPAFKEVIELDNLVYSWSPSRENCVFRSHGEWKDVLVKVYNNLPFFKMIKDLQDSWNKEIRTEYTDGTIEVKVYYPWVSVYEISSKSKLMFWKKPLKKKVFNSLEWFMEDGPGLREFKRIIEEKRKDF